MVLNVHIVDDELHCRENLGHLIQEYCPRLLVSGMASSVSEAKELLKNENPDVVFLDIRMPGGDGFQLLEQIDLSRTAVVFTTAHNEYAIRALKEGAIDYLEKPIDIQELEDCAQRLERRKETREQLPASSVQQLLQLGNMKELDKTTIPTSDGFLLVNSSDIVRLEASDSYTKIWMSDGTRHMSSKNIRVFEDRLNPLMFFRTHKSHIINTMYHLKAFSRRDGNVAIMSNGDAVPVSRRKLATFLEQVQA